MVIIGLGHKARRGKDTAAKAILVARRGKFDVRTYAFAEKLKDEVNQAAVKAGGMFALFQELIVHGAPLPTGQFLKLPDWVEYEHNPIMTDPLCPLGKQRKLLQWWGTEYRRVACDRFYWVRAMKERLDKEQPQFAVLTDMRFQNEFLWVKANSGYTIELERLGFRDVDTNASHKSEHELDGAPFDFTITVKDGDVKELETDAVKVFDMIVESLSPYSKEVEYAA